MADSPELGSDGPVTVTVKIDGAEVPDKMLLQSVVIQTELNRIPEARLVYLSESLQFEDSDLIDNSIFALGGEIEVAAGYGGGAESTIFEGLILSHRLRLDESRGLRLELTCRDRAIQMTEARTSALYENKKDSDVMSAIIGDAGLDADVTATTETAPSLLCATTSAWDILRMLADRNGHLLKIADGTITSAPPDLKANAKLTVTYGTDIFALDIEMDASRMIGSTTASAWSEKDQTAVSSVYTTLPGLKLGDTTDKTVAEVLSSRARLDVTAADYTAGDLKTFARARLDRASLAIAQGSVKFQGNGTIAPGDVLEIKGSGDRFSGNGLVSGVEHVIDAGSWTTQVRLGLQQDWRGDASDFGAASGAVATPVHGLQIGKVVRIDADPDGRQRIQVSLPMLGDPAVQVWARMAAPYASNAFGMQFLPEIDDEVVVAFLSGDANAPVILGSLHNDKAKRPVTAESGNDIKAIKTRSALLMQFDDDKKIITVETPGGHKLVMDDDATSITMRDSNGNSLVMDASGITMSSDKDITIKATGNLTAQATSDTSVSGMNVTCEADMGFTGKGGTTAEVSSGAQTTVKGGMVMIN